MLGYQNRYSTNAYGAYAPTALQQYTLIQRVCFLLATGLLVSAAGAFAAREFPLSSGLVWGTFIVAIGLLYVMKAVARKPGVNVLVFYLFSLVEGVFLGPLLSLYARAFGSNLIWEALLLTAITVAGVGGYAYTSGKDFGFLGRGLMFALLGLILFGIASWFVMGLNTPMIVLGYETIVVAVFVGFLLYDFSNIKLRYSPEDYTIAAVQVYLDFINLFLAILNILAILQGGGGSRRR